ncbi:MAG TPA: YibE/F family protein, partial [Pseudonocardiaceae bacterium]|nr:YibE/F family protein [Pseudonocardiaceae bacterium]
MPPASRRVKMLLAAALVPVALATLVGLWLTWPSDTPRSGVDIGFGQRPVHGEILAARSAPCSSASAGIGEAEEAKKCISLDV